MYFRRCRSVRVELQEVSQLVGASGCSEVCETPRERLRGCVCGGTPLFTRTAAAPYTPHVIKSSVRADGKLRKQPFENGVARYPDKKK